MIALLAQFNLLDSKHKGLLFSEIFESCMIALVISV